MNVNGIKYTVGDIVECGDGKIPYTGKIIKISSNGLDYDDFYIEILMDFPDGKKHVAWFSERHVRPYGTSPLYFGKNGVPVFAARLFQRHKSGKAK